MDQDDTICCVRISRRETRAKAEKEKGKTLLVLS